MNTRPIVLAAVRAVKPCIHVTRRSDLVRRASVVRLAFDEFRVSRHRLGSQRCRFGTSPCLLKKGGAKAKGGKKDEQQQAVENSRAKDAPSDDPSDFAKLEGDIAESLERLKEDLSKLRAGGRFNPEVVENLRVQPDKSSSQTVKLGDVAQVIPKGRTVQIMVGDKDHIKPVTTAIQTSKQSLNPQPDPTGTNPLLLTLNIPPPTAESRKQAVTAAVEAGHKARIAIAADRAKQQKKLGAMQKQKSARPDDLKKAGDQMEKMVEKAQEEAKRVVNSAKKVLESG